MNTAYLIVPMLNRFDFYSTKHRSLNNYRNIKCCSVKKLQFFILFHPILKRLGNQCLETHALRRYLVILR